MKNIWRIIFWGIILIISLCAGVLGVIYSNQNFNKRKNDLVNIVETFNSNQLINNYKKIDVNLTAKLSDKNIIVSYTGNVNKDYIFKFKKNYLETTINKNDSIGDIVVMLITDSVSILSKITNNEVYKSILYQTINNIVNGDKISDAFKDHWAIPDVAYFMIVTGESTGELAEMMQKVSDYYQEAHRNLINSLKSFIEPVMICVLAVVVGVILVAVIVPMFQLYDELLSNG